MKVEAFFMILFGSNGSSQKVDQVKKLGIKHKFVYN